MSSPLEVAFLLANLRAVGLMPDSDFQRINDALIELIRKRVYNETGLGLADNFIYVDNDDPSTKFPNPFEIFDISPEDGRESIPYKDWSSRISDDDLWRHVMPLYRRKKRDVDEYSERILREEDYDLVDLFNKEGLTESSGYLDPPCIFDNLAAQFSEVSMKASRAQLVALSMKVDALEREVSDLRSRPSTTSFVISTSPQKGWGGRSSLILAMKGSVEPREGIVAPVSMPCSRASLERTSKWWPHGQSADWVDRCSISCRCSAI